MTAVIGALETFATEARAYVAFIARAGSLPLGERLVQARAQLLAVYTAGSALPPLPGVEDGDAEPGENPPRPDGWTDFGQHDWYYEVFDPYVKDELVMGSLEDDLLDVFFDVSQGLALWDAGHRREAHWHWRFRFDVHWGDHAVDALRALHRACKPRD